MANTIQIKRGNSAPRAGTLLDGELGFDKANDQLYIGKVDGGSTVNIKVGLKNGVGYNEENQESAIVPLNADTLQGHPASDFRLSNWLPTAAEVSAAPTGYGLGEGATAIDSWANAVRNGYYRSSNDTPDGNGNGWHGIVVSYSTALCNQFVWKTWDAGTRMATRRVYNGVAEPWEWINPPMIAGTEYRTTERWNGKPVFTQLIDCGLSADKKTISYLNSEQISAVIRHAGRISGSVAPQANNNDWANAWSLQFLVSTTSAGLRCGTSLVGKQTYLQIWYVKGAQFE